MPADLTYPRRLVKAPTEVRDFFEDFQAYEELRSVADGGEAQTISSCSVSATPSGLTIGTAAVSGTKVVATISSGTADTTYDVRFTAVTSGGKTLSRKILLDVKDV